jgi:anti-anti-sigma factor
MSTTEPQHLVSITKLTKHYDTQVSSVEFRGVVRDQTVSQFREYLEQAGKRSPFLLVDMSRVSYLSSTGLGMMVAQARFQGNMDGWLRVVSPSPTVSMILNLTGVSESVTPVPSIEAGVLDLSTKAA